MYNAFKLLDIKFRDLHQLVFSEQIIMIFEKKKTVILSVNDGYKMQITYRLTF